MISHNFKAEQYYIGALPLLKSITRNKVKFNTTVSSHDPKYINTGPVT
jgi:hypothetical protein